jgi:hypothetical protein
MRLAFVRTTGEKVSGGAFFEALQAICRERGIARSFVITNERNRTAMAFYRAVGATRNATDDVVLDFDWS